ncbi:hypothetical protein KY290_036141 [Solanum tuberosum]|uniref:Uncharacterized protein n=1 Tax=Solanum tuberosum TaxID=4113 RepID=A0ABQ7TSA5_SOLTU|nr:hypothetical protein KY290_036141 [Solanum tuberosum]
MDDANNKPMVYEFYENPSLDVLATSSEAYRTSLPANTNKARRNGTISQDIRKSSSYYVALGNLNYGVVQGKCINIPSLCPKSLRHT